MTIVVTGTNSGLGRAIFGQLIKQGANVFPVGFEEYGDLSDEESLVRVEKSCPQHITGLINCAGTNHIDWFENLDPANFNALYRDNVMSIVGMTQTLLPRLIESKGTVLNIVSNASHMPMTHSAAYNASKGAAEILTRQMARELTKRFGITVFGISPNKLKGTGMSSYIDNRVCELRGWSPEEAQEYQLTSLLAGEETDPSALAEFIGFLMERKERNKYLTGTIIPYGL